MGDVYYNENDRYAAQWLRNLIEAGHLPGGRVDDRSIVDVRPEDLDGYGQCHFFAGVGGWPLALRLAGWPEDRPVWTGSVPCQPLSSAGQRKGHADERHLWPAFQSLIAERHPATVLGEQVASKDGREWLCGVRADLEDLGYAVGAADLCVAGVGAPHIRQRLWWVADAGHAEPPGRIQAPQDNGRSGGTRRVKGREPAPCGADGGVGDATEPRRTGGKDAGTNNHHAGEGPRRIEPERTSEPGRMGDPRTPGLSPRQREAMVGAGWREEGRTVVQSGGSPGGVDDTGGQRHRHGQGLHARSRPQGRTEAVAVGAGPFVFWTAHDLIPCADGKSRPVEPSTFPLAARLPLGVGKLRARRRRMAALAGLDARSLRDAKSYRIGSLRGYGNAINPYVAAEFIQAFLEAT